MGSNAARKIQAILRSSNHFDTLQLPKPYADLAGEPVWDVSEDQVAKAFRKLSLCCHPDKSTDPEAPRAFEVLKKAKACLLNELDRDDYVRDFVKNLKTVWEGSWAQAEEALSSKERVTSMRDEAQQEQNESVFDAMQQRHAQAAQKARQKERAEKARGRSRVRQLEEEEAAAAKAAAEAQLGIDDDDDDDDAPPVVSRSSAPPRPGAGAGKARKKPKFM